MRCRLKVNRQSAHFCKLNLLTFLKVSSLSHFPLNSPSNTTDLAVASDSVSCFGDISYFQARLIKT